MAGSDEPTPPPSPLDTWPLDTEPGEVARRSVDTWAPDAALRAPESPTADVSTDEVPRYAAAGLLGQGGIATVHAARDDRLGREVALKRLRRQGSRASRRRFLREARITAQLEHPHIVPVHDAGVSADGTPFYTMKYVRGTALSAALARAASLQDRLAMLPAFVSVCQAMAYAHERRVIHRDLKPDNLMLGEFGEALVVDWGLARALDEDDEPTEEEPRPLDIDHRALTIVGQVSGTPAYMAPEQARGESTGLATDVYALGAILYELLTGSPPHGISDDVTVQLERARTGTVRPPRERTPDAPAELAAIAERALSVAPGDRYPSAKELLDDLQRFTAGRMVQAYQYSPREQMVRLVRRYRVPLGLGAAALAAAGIVGTIGFVNVRAERDRAQANEARAVQSEAKAQATTAELRRQLSEILAERAQASFDVHDYPTARALAVASLVEGETPEGRGTLVGAWAVPRFVHDTTATAPHGCRQLAWWGEGFVCQGEHSVSLLADDGAVRWTRPTDSPAPGLAVVEARDAVVIPTKAGIAWLDRAGQQVGEAPGQLHRGLAVSPRGAIGWVTPEGTRWLSADDELHVDPPATYLVTATVFADEVRHLAGASGRLWQPETRHDVARVRDVVGAATRLDHGFLLGGSRLSFVPDDGGEVAVVPAPGGTTRHLDGSGTLAAGVSVEGVAFVAHAASGKLLAAAAPGPPHSSVALEGDRLLTSFGDLVLAWHLQGELSDVELTTTSHHVSYVTTSADGATALRCLRDGTVEQLGPDGRVAQRWVTEARLPTLCHYTPDHAVVQNLSHRVELRADGTQRAVPHPPGQPYVTYVADTPFTPRELPHAGAIVHQGPEVTILEDLAQQDLVWWSLDDGGALHEVHRRGVVQPIFAEPDGLVARWEQEGPVLLEDARTGAPRGELIGHRARATTVARIDEHHLATGSWDREIRIWDLRTGETIARLQGHEGRIYDLGYHADAQILHSTSFDGTYRMWDLAVLHTPAEELYERLKVEEAIDARGGTPRLVP